MCLRLSESFRDELTGLVHIMRCPKCGKKVAFKTSICDGCNADLSSYRKLYNISNQYYNVGLEKAKVRDLSGAIVALKNSLQVNKRNTDARNLLGLVYYEIGETVLALGEWVLSKNYQENDNEAADYYMNILQANTNRLHNTNQIIKKYNYALAQAESGNYDVALLQLKKVVSSQPNYVAAQQLLALLYMQQGDNEKAARTLRKAQKVDITNTRTLSYLAELGLNPSAVKVDREIAKRNQSKGKALEKAENPQFVQDAPVLRDGKINKWSLVYLLIGVAIGLLTVIFLVLPTRENAIASKYNSEAVAMAEEQTNLSSKIQTLENEKTELNQKISDLEADLQKVKDEAVDESAYNKFLKAVTGYINGEKEAAAETLIAIDISKFNSGAAKDLYNVIKEDTFADMSKKKYREGYSAYSSGRNEDAIAAFKLAIKYDADNVDAMYYLARCYQATGDDKKARKYYKKIINDYPNEISLASQATRRLEAMSE